MPSLDSFSPAQFVERSDFYRWKDRQEKLFSRLMEEHKYITNLWNQRDQEIMPSERQSVDLSPSAGKNRTASILDDQVDAALQKLKNVSPAGRSDEEDWGTRASKTSMSSSLEESGSSSRKVAITFDEPVGASASDRSEKSFTPGASLRTQGGFEKDDSFYGYHRSRSAHADGVLPRSISTTSTDTPEDFNDQWHAMLVDDQMMKLRFIVAEHYEVCVGTLVVSNALFVGWQKQQLYTTGVEPSIASEGNLAFCIAFVFDLIFRFFCLQKRDWAFIYSQEWRWNLFDALVVACMVFEQALLISDAEHEVADYVSVFSMLRLCRVFRWKILRSLRLAHMLPSFRTGRLLLISLERSYGLILWVFILQSSLAYIAAVFMSHGAAPFCNDHQSNIDSVNRSNRATSDQTIEEVLCNNFGSPSSGFVTSVEAILGGVSWGLLLEALMELDFRYATAYVIYLVGTKIIIINIIVGICVHHVGRVAEEEHEDVFLEDRMQQNHRFIGRMTSVFEKLDINTSGGISRDELAHAYKDQDMIALLGSMTLDDQTPDKLFELLDRDHSGTVNISEFVLGCLKLRVPARNLDVERICQNVDDAARQLLHAVDYMYTHSKGLDVPADIEGTRSVAKEGEYRSQTRHGLKTSASCVMMDEGHTKITRSMISKNLQGVRIEDTELRAMLLSEMIDIETVIASCCAVEQWTDRESGTILTPGEVNMYHFNHYVICPETASDDITLVGLKEAQFTKDTVLMQVGSRGSTIAEGTVKEDSSGTSVKILLRRGQFVASNLSSAGDVMMDGVALGIPSQVVHKNSISYKELVSSTPTPPSWYICHWWGMAVYQFVSFLNEHAKKRNLQDPSYWVCGYANRQHELDVDICTDPSASSFSKAMRLADGVLLLLDPKAIPFSRIWCDYELFTTISSSDKLLDIVAFNGRPRLLTQGILTNESFCDKRVREQRFPVNLLARGMQVELQNGSASVEQDKLNILEIMSAGRIEASISGKARTSLSVANGNDRIELANNALRGYFALAAWPQALKHGIVESFDMGGGSSAHVSLPDILNSDERRHMVQLSFSGLEVNDADMVSIARGLPPQANSVSLSFESCNMLTDSAIGCLAQKLASLPLNCLHLDLLGCNLVTDASVAMLARNLPETLTDFELDLSLCPKISKDGVEALAENLPRNVTKLRAAFTGTKFDKTFQSPAQLTRMVRR